ncbi:methylamine dehydrogenase (amicyanin) small subunit [Achromobacter seleniivolatilans]|uniref:Methylamine dehydrogenase light chain n=1 Tax=Achromobacter seleniivolatilans TaxID=3047478 RepID=A0ABY9M9T9_9BURK|nr:methylamine dehydrogenase (amicyanin) small subunit [Achromobacter sp. R39]WMD23753.1 methylamine dehydrogenase (amicyanin) small subunit [Achromobacter sp. R39]
MKSLDGNLERLFRRTAQRTSRRGALAKIGGLLAGAASVPLLPVSRAAQAAPDHAAHASDFSKTAQTEDPTACNYWRYCSTDGYLCSCCGGTASSCPPGTTPSLTSWIGSCINPSDGKTYLISYQDCCGQDACGRCACLGQEGEMPTYRPQLNNNIIWCFGSSSMVYHCSSALLVGLAE